MRLFQLKSPFLHFFLSHHLHTHHLHNHHLHNHHLHTHPLHTHHLHTHHLHTHHLHTHHLHTHPLFNLRAAIFVWKQSEVIEIKRCIYKLNRKRKKLRKSYKHISNSLHNYETVSIKTISYWSLMYAREDSNPQPSGP